MPIRLPLGSMETPGGSCEGSVTVKVDGAAAALPGRVPLIGALAEPDRVSVGSAGGGFWPARAAPDANRSGTGRVTQVSWPQILTVTVVVPAVTGVPLSVPLLASVTPVGSELAGALTVTGACTSELVIDPLIGVPAVPESETAESLAAGANSVSPVIVIPWMLLPPK